MKTLYSAAELRMDISALEAKRLRQEQEMKHTLTMIADDLKPVNLIRNTFNSTVRQPGFGKSVLKGAIGVLAGFITKKVFLRGSTNIVKKALGSVVEVGVARAVSSRADKITETGAKLLSKVMK